MHSAEPVLWGPLRPPPPVCGVRCRGVPPCESLQTPRLQGLCPPRSEEGEARGSPSPPERPPAPSPPVRSSLLWWESWGHPGVRVPQWAPLWNGSWRPPGGPGRAARGLGGTAAHGTCRTWARSAAGAHRRPSAGSRRPRSPGPACGTGTGTRGRVLGGPGSVLGLRAVGEAECPQATGTLPQCPVSSGRRPLPAPLAEACLGAEGSDQCPPGTGGGLQSPGHQPRPSSCCAGHQLSWGSNCTHRSPLAPQGRWLGPVLRRGRGACPATPC